jgi:hypothetical protein
VVPYALPRIGLRLDSSSFHYYKGKSPADQARTSARFSAYLFRTRRFSAQSTTSFGREVVVSEKCIIYNERTTVVVYVHDVIPLDRNYFFQEEGIPIPISRSIVDAGPASPPWLSNDLSKF